MRRRALVGTWLASGTQWLEPRVRATGQAMSQRRTKNALVVLFGLALACLGVYNIVLKATWTLMDDGVFWRSAPEGLVAARIDPGGPASRSGVRSGDILIAVNEDEVLTRADLDGQPARLNVMWVRTSAEDKKAGAPKAARASKAAAAAG